MKVQHFSYVSFLHLNVQRTAKVCQLSLGLSGDVTDLDLTYLDVLAWLIFKRLRNALIRPQDG